MWEINGREFYDIDDATQEIIDNITEETFDEFLDEVYPMVEFGSFSWYPSQVLKEMDPVAYDCGMRDYTDNWREDIAYTLSRMEPEEDACIYGTDVTCKGW